MFFDDRLATVLRQRADSDVGKRTQFRQLLDILGAERRRAERVTRDPSLLAAAWLRMDALGRAIPADRRAEMIREPGWRFRNPQLAAHLAEFEPDVAAAALARANLSAEDWSALIPRLPVRARGFVRLRRDLPVDVENLLERLGVHDRGLPSPPTSALPAAAVEAEPEIEDEPLDLTTEFATKAEPEPLPEVRMKPEPVATPRPAFDPASEGRSEISALVERIAQFKRSRDSSAPQSKSAHEGDDPTMPRLPLGEDQHRSLRRSNGFGFAADAAARIEWADGEVASMVIGTKLVASSRLAATTPESLLARAVSRRQPIVGASIHLAGAEAIAGDWVVDAQPRFTDGGNFAGYVGRFRRPAGEDAGAATAAAREADRIRQLLHELRTPVTAVQGYAEVIQQQLFGTAPHEYRALAAAIAADAARILAGFEELDRLARLETGAAEIEAGEADLAALAHRINAQLSQVLDPRMAGLNLEADTDGPTHVALAEDQAEALLWRLLATLGGGCAAGELLEARITVGDQNCELTCDLPAQLLKEEDIFTAEVRPVGSAINAGLFGAGFALRLARAEADAAGGGLVRDDERLVLTLPLAETGSASDNAARG
ncbi:MAG: histidine kinase dimerization/phospho-acceptor domain-containing protein [Erythrobacter sp.]